MEKLIEIKNEIEKMNKSQQIEVYRIIKMNNIDYNENKNGIFINLTNLNNNIIKELEKYINFIKNQNVFLNKREEQKEKYINNYFKENLHNINNDEEFEPTTEPQSPKSPQQQSPQPQSPQPQSPQQQSPQQQSPQQQQQQQQQSQQQQQQSQPQSETNNAPQLYAN